MSRPAPERPGDALPTPDDFAGWPPLGALSLTAVAGPVVARMSRLDARAREALVPFADGEPPARPLRVDLQWTRASRPPWLSLLPGDRARSAAWIEGGGLAWATHHAALLMDSGAERGIVVLTDQDAAEAERSAQNVLRVATAWRLAASGSGLLLHASAVEDAGAATLFLGPSGAGKSTAARLSAPRPVLADDACIVTTGERGIRLHPAPFWAEPGITHRCDRGYSIHVSRILRLRQAPSHGMSLLGRASGVAAIAAHAPFLEGLSPGLSALDAAKAIADEVPVAELLFARDPGFWKTIPDGARDDAGQENTE